MTFSFICSMSHHNHYCDSLMISHILCRERAGLETLSKHYPYLSHLPNECLCVFIKILKTQQTRRSGQLLCRNHLPLIKTSTSMLHIQDMLLPQSVVEKKKNAPKIPWKNM